MKTGDRGTAFVTGGAVRVGRAIVEELSALGFSVAIHCNQSRQPADELRQHLEDLGHSAFVYQADLTSSSGLDSLLDEVAHNHPDLNLLVNNAAGFGGGNFLETTYETFDRMFSLNLRAPFFLTQNFARKVRRGQVINILDTYIERNSGSPFAYHLTKKALADLTRMCAYVVGPHIRVNALAPGMVIPIGEECKKYASLLEVEAPLQRTPALENLMDALVFLLNAQSTTGQVLFVDAGRHL